jgi:hypothetical protein
MTAPSGKMTVTPAAIHSIHLGKMADSTSIQLPRLKSIHIMHIAGVFAIVFGVLSTRREESVLGLTLLFAVGCVWIVARMLRVNPFKVVLAQLPENTDEKIAALADGLVRCNPHDVSTNSLARYRLVGGRTNGLAGTSA